MTDQTPEDDNPDSLIGPIAGDYTSHVTFVLLADVLKVLRDHGINWHDEDPKRRADALVALAKLADAIAGQQP